MRAAGCALRLAPKLGARRPEELAALAIDAAAIVSTDPSPPPSWRVPRACK
jgi:hypothetical protein